MQTYELENEVFNGLISNAELLALLPKGAKSIFHHQAPSVEPANYPIIVYSPISDVPILSADNLEIMHKVTIRTHIIIPLNKTALEKEKFIQTCRIVTEIMTSLKFRRVQSTPFINDGKEMLIIDFVRGVES